MSTELAPFLVRIVIERYSPALRDVVLFREASPPANPAAPYILSAFLSTDRLSVPVLLPDGSRNHYAVTRGRAPPVRLLRRETPFLESNVRFISKQLLRISGNPRYRNCDSSCEKPLRYEIAFRSKVPNEHSPRKIQLGRDATYSRLPRRCFRLGGPVVSSAIGNRGRASLKKSGKRGNERGRPWKAFRIRGWNDARYSETLLRFIAFERGKRTKTEEGTVEKMQFIYRAPYR